METKKDLEALVATRMFNPPTAKRKRRAHIQNEQIEKVARRLIAKRDSVDGVPFSLLYSTTAVPDPGVALLYFGVSALEDLMDENYTPGLAESPSVVRKKYEKIARSLKEAAKLLKRSGLDMPIGDWISDSGSLKYTRPTEPKPHDVTRSKVSVDADNVATVTHSSSAAVSPQPNELLSELLELVTTLALNESKTPSHTAWITGCTAVHTAVQALFTGPNICKDAGAFSWWGVRAGQNGSLL